MNPRKPKKLSIRGRHYFETLTVHDYLRRHEQKQNLFPIRAVRPGPQDARSAIGHAERGVDRLGFDDRPLYEQTLFVRVAGEGLGLYPQKCQPSLRHAEDGFRRGFFAEAAGKRDVSFS